MNTKNIHSLLWGFLILTAYSLIATLLLGDKGFFNDDWSIVSFPFWHRLPYAFVEGALHMRRPTQSVYYGIALKATNYNTSLLYFFSLMQLIIANILMGVALLVAFPGRRVMALIAVLVGFFLPMVTPGSYWLAADNMRLASIFYWLSVLLFQHWIIKPQIGSLPLLPIFMFLFGLLSYESIVALPVITALMCLPIYWRHNGNQRWYKHMITGIQLIIAHGISFLLMLYVRDVYQIRSHVNTEGSQPVTLAGTYIVQFFQWMLEPFKYVLQNADFISVLIGVATALIIGFILWRLRPSVSETGILQSKGYVLLISVATVIMGLLPFLLFNIIPDVGDAIDSRGYITTAFGIAMLVGYGLSLMWEQNTLRRIAITIFSIWIGLLATYNVNLRLEYQQASERRQVLHAALYDTVPNLMDDTVILYLNYDDSVGIAAVQAENASNYYTQMFYNNRSVHGAALNLEPTGFEPTVTDDKLAIPSKEVPLDQIVIVRRVDDMYELVDSVSSDDPYIINWEGDVTAIYTNYDRILPALDEPHRFHKLVGFDPNP